MFFFQSCATCLAVSVQCAGSTASRLTFAADASGQSGLVLSAVAGIAPVLMGQMGAGARSRPARRRPELTAPGAAPVRAAASSSPAHGLLCAVAHAGAARVQRQARLAGAPVQPGQVPGCRGRQAADGTAGSQRDRPTGTDRVAAGLLADGLTRCLAAGIGRVTLLIT